MSYQKEPLTVFLYNPISGQGHLDSYARIYTEACLRLGYRTVLVSGSDAGITDYVHRCLPSECAQRFTWVSFHEADRSDSELQRIKQSQVAIRNRLGPICVTRALLRRTSSAWLHVTKGAYRVIRPMLPPKCQHWLASISQSINPDHGRITYALVATRVCSAGRLTKLSPSLVFVLYLDLMSHRLSDIRTMDSSIGCGWAGILFHPARVRNDAQPLERLFASNSLKGLLFLNPYSVVRYQDTHPHLFFVRAPDVTVTECTESNSRLAQSMVAQAAGRRIVLMIGAISGFKGLKEFIDIIKHPNSHDLFFAIIGHVHWSTLGRDEQDIRDFYSRASDNVFTHDAYLEDEAVYNELVSCSDVIYAVYRGAMGSSNTLTKAAFFARPVLVAEDSYLGELVLASGTGAVVEPGNAQAACQALNELLCRSIPKASYDAYYRSNSLTALQATLEKAFRAWCDSGFDPSSLRTVATDPSFPLSGSGQD